MVAPSDRDVTDSCAPAIIPGLRLTELFFEEVVGPILARDFPALRYSAALIGPGSDVFGYDTARSSDHDWGPRLLILVSEENLAAYASAIHALLARRLPLTGGRGKKPTSLSRALRRCIHIGDRTDLSILLRPS